jgi:hypothetical protein
MSKNPTSPSEGKSQKATPSLFRATTLRGMLEEYEQDVESLFNETMQTLGINTTHKACFNSKEEAEALNIADGVCNPAPEFGRDAKVDPTEAKRWGVKKEKK